MGLPFEVNIYFWESQGYNYYTNVSNQGGSKVGYQGPWLVVQLFGALSCPMSCFLHLKVVSNQLMFLSLIYISLLPLPPSSLEKKKLESWVCVRKPTYWSAPKFNWKYIFFKIRYSPGAEYVPIKSQSRNLLIRKSGLGGGGREWNCWF